MTRRETGPRDAGRRRLDALTGLRFFAAAAIVLHHLPGTFGLQPGYHGDARLAQGVSVFFVLSGFVLRYAYPALPTAADVRGFLVARIARIWPLHVLTLMAAVWLKGFQDLPTFLANLFLLQSWIPQAKYFFGYNGVSWSISTELAFYLFFPVLILRFAQDWYWKLLAFATLTFAIALFVASMDVPLFDGNRDAVVMQGFVMTNPLARMFEFVLGMACAHLWLKTDPRGGFAVWTIVELLAVLFLLFNVTLILKSLAPHLPQHKIVIFWMALVASPALPVAILLPVLATGRGLVSAFLSHPVVRFLGDASFAIYMTHQLMLIPFRSTTFGFLPIPGQILLYFAVVILLSSALHVGFEVPCQRMIRTAFGRVRSAGRGAEPVLPGPHIQGADALTQAHGSTRAA